ncbi:hypothetical protein BDV19DRAFT_393040 [Aspergillus venezuelensis]
MLLFQHKWDDRDTQRQTLKLLLRFGSPVKGLNERHFLDADLIKFSDEGVDTEVFRLFYETLLTDYGWDDKHWVILFFVEYLTIGVTALNRGSGKNGKTPPIRAVRAGNYAKAQFLVLAGADPCKADQKGMTPLGHSYKTELTSDEEEMDVDRMVRILYSGMFPAGSGASST